MTDQQYNKYNQFDDLDGVPKDLSQGPRTDRSCTDIACCCFFTLFIGLTLLITWVGLLTGDPQILAQPYDMNHHPCGIHDNSGYPYIYFPSPKVISKNVCVVTCPDKDSKSVTCLKNDICPSGTLEQDVSNGIIIYQTIPVAGKICIPLNKEYFASVSESLDIGFFEQVASDLRNTWMICSSSVFFALILAFIFMYFVRIAAGSIVWTFILLIFVCLGTLGSLFYFQYLQLTNPPAMDSNTTNNSAYKAMANTMSYFKDKNTVLYASIFFFSLTGLFLLTICCICKKIRLAIQVVKASARFMIENPRVMLVPIVSFVVSTAFFAAWFILGLYLISSGGISNEPGALPFGHVKITRDIKIMGWTHLFGLFWYESFFAACQQMIIIGAVAFWYFQVPEDEDSNTTMSAKLFFGNHMGTAAFGSFILGVLAFVKFIISLLAAQAESMKKKGEESTFFEYMYKILYCFVWAFEKCFKHLSGTAYVWTVMDGKNFCPSARRALALYILNPLRMTLVAGFGEIFESLGSIAICVISSLSAYMVISKTAYYQERVDDPIAPVLVIAIVSYYVGSFVMSLFGTVSEALIAIFCMEENMGVKASSKCPQELKEFMNSLNDD